MAPTAASSRRTVGSRRVGYLLGAAIDGVLIFLINVSPGWQVIGFLSEDTPRVLGLVNLSLTVGLIAYLVYAVHDPPWLKALGDLISVVISLAVLVRVWQVFPFEFTTSFNWAAVFRIVLVLAMIGTTAGTIASFVRVVRTIGARTR